MDAHRTNDELEKLNIMIMDMRSNRNAIAAKRKKNRAKKSSNNARRKLMRQKLRSGGIIGGSGIMRRLNSSGGDNRKKLQDPISSGLTLKTAFDVLTAGMECDSFHEVVDLYNKMQDDMFNT